MSKYIIRQALKEIESFIANMSIGLEEDYMMDDSGECGNYIYLSWKEWFTERYQAVLKKYSLSHELIMKLTNEWAQVELVRGPKQVWIYLESKSNGAYVPKTVFDTRWGQLNWTIYQFAE